MEIRDILKNVKIQFSAHDTFVYALPFYTARSPNINI